MNQEQIVRQRRKMNVFLALTFCALLVWVIIEARREIKRVCRLNQPLTAQKININRDANTIKIKKLDGTWTVVEPYQQKASEVVVNALLGRIQHGCRVMNDIPSRMPQFYAEISIDGSVYKIGELNHSSDEIYILHQKDWLLCDKLLAAMALAPAISFIDKQLYEGELHTIIGDFGRLTDFGGVDLSVLEVAPAEVDKLPKHMISKLKFIADNERNYQAFLSEDNKHLLLFDEDKSMIYVVASNVKLNAVLGL